MAIFRRRLVSSKDLFYGFVACSFPIFLWAFYKIFNQTPSLVMKMSLIDAISVGAYALAISFVESLIICAFLILLAAVIPERFFRKKFVPHTMVLMLVTAVWAVIGQFNYQKIYDWTFSEVLPWLLLYLGSCLVFYLLVQRFDRLAGLIYRIVQWISVLATLYVSLGVIGLVIVFFRNL